MAATDEKVDDLLRSLYYILKKKRMRSTDLFRSIDVSGDGLVSAEELRNAMVEIGLRPSAEDFSALVLRLDQDASGDITFKEFDKALKYAGTLTSQTQHVRPDDRRGGAKQTRGLTAEDKEEFRQIFCLFKQLCRARSSSDSGEPELVHWDESGNISVDELEQLLETVGVKLDASELDAMVRDIDIDGDGHIDFEEFCATMTRKIQVDYSQEEITKAFKTFQRNAPKGMIRVKDLHNALKTYLHKDMIDAEVDELILHYKDCFVKLHGSDEEYFNYQDYIDLMTPIASTGPGAE